MSSPESIHEDDTPASGDSAPSVSVRSPCSTPKLILQVKDEMPSKSPSPDLNGSSCSSSPNDLPITPTSSANGILTPPPTDGDNANEIEKYDKLAGRLKFYKNGILCLELSHHNEGPRTKWVQIRTKTVFPTVVHTTKEATIPCHVSPQSFASPSSSNALQSRIESSTSHSMSDDGSSMLSSPRLRENTWKQSVPQKGISTCLEFFMKPSVCVLNLRRVFCETSNPQIIKFSRKPYDCQIPTILCRNTEKYLCCGPTCNESVTENYKSVLTNGKPVVGAGTEVCEKLHNGCLSVIENEVSERTKTKRNYRNKRKLSILVVADRLNSERQLKLKEEVENGDSKLDCGVSSTKTHALLKKRVFKEMDARDSVVRPKKKSPSRNVDSKTILNVPGLNSEFYRRHSKPKETSGTVSQQHGVASFTGNEVNSDALSNHRSFNKVGKNGISFGKRSGNNSPYHIGAKSLSPTYRSPKKNVSSEQHDLNPISNSINNAMCLSSLPPQEQEQFQRQTMSKAISYTINSLLNSPGSSEMGSRHSLLKSNNEPSPVRSIKTEKAVHHPENRSGNILQPEIPSGLFGTRDQNSFLRHLLDTSDPIPSAKPDKNLTKPTSKGSSSSRHNSKVSAGDTNVAVDFKKNNTNSKSRVPQNSSKKPASSNLTNCQLPQYPPLLHPSLVNGGFPLSLTSAYDTFIRSQEQHPANPLAAAAAAAAFQYSSLLPPHMFSNLSSTMAAAVAASYLGGSPSIPGTNSSQSLLSSRSPSTSHSNSPINYSSNSNGGSPLNLSQRAWQSNGGHCSGTIPVPFHAPVGDRILSGAFTSRQTHSKDRLDKTNEIVDDDTPLNLSKKPRPN